MDLTLGKLVRYVNKKGKEKIGEITDETIYENKFIYIDEKKVKINKILHEWIPKINEICLFYNKDFKSFRIAKFRQIAYGMNRKGMYKDIQGNYFDYCKPYTKKTLKELINKI